MNHNKLVHHSSINALYVKRLPKILLGRRFLCLGVSCIFMSIFGLLAINTKPNYKSSMQILVHSNLYEGVRLNNIQLGENNELTESKQPMFDYIAQMKLMVSSKLIQKAVDILHSDYPNLTIEDIKGNNNDKKSPLVVQQLSARTGVNEPRSQVFEVSFYEDDPVKTQKVLQALLKVYQDHNIQQQKEQLNQGLNFVSTRLPQIKQELSQAEKNLENFRSKHNIVDPEVQSKIVLESLAKIEKQREIARAQLKNVQAQYNNLEEKIIALSENAEIASRLNQSSRYQWLLNEIKKTELAIAKEEMRYTEESPILENLKEQHQSQKTLLQQEMQELLGDKKIDNNSKKLLLIQGETAEVIPSLVEEFIEVQTIIKGLIAHDNSLSESERRLSSQLRKYPSLIAEYNRLLPVVETKRKILEQLLQTQQYLGLKISQGGFDWQVLEEPNLGTATSNRRSILVLGGFVVSPILGIAVALTWGMFNYTIYSLQELQKLTKVQLLGSVPKLALRNFKKRLPMLFWQQRENLALSLVETNTWLPCHESFDMVYQNIQVFNHSYPLKSLMLTSALSREGKTTLALGLAASAARRHGRILLIDANLRYPQLHNILQLSNDWGLSLLLLDEANAEIENYIQPIHPAIDVLTAGPTPEDIVNLLSQQRMQELIKFFDQTYDLVIIDAPPILDSVDAGILASLCQGIVMVGRMGYVTPKELTQAIAILSKLNLVGIIANDVSGE
ncbi:GumC family protein [Umezakia ovalisporum]|uniref:non-specific protein-tyrosine kinase n=2 Tax=Umezakia ovalisporum TaxID=75695 RepID=A0AA43H0P3_9CYAN|nr:polysaccharide biosynthesis tyrosine autokinase [Umezakia ovalisporum]MDH6058445.1 polysaccharide biosynthesis tyrosine autokinase [Umezakia ovalisporum FSS-43]MDH6065211.1 polysaccharide biosynthesis tyrosine autokinase [Umezakia ovalisporum FSS-62]MDH6067060.1 polysaccharide biosynthesis tyrosine autokinase [Umezakia ovalisporum APH033B]MDH6071671.1 polysaccharide biosynthesis tyrosine autokinase [Umezakia ovalisporum CobakiLakeA]MDH6073234.1 polysaccharide biosynthesis tyrosine autokinas